MGKVNVDSQILFARLMSNNVDISFFGECKETTEALVLDSSRANISSRSFKSTVVAELAAISFHMVEFMLGPLTLLQKNGFNLRDDRVIIADGRFPTTPPIAGIGGGGGGGGAPDPWTRKAGAGGGGHSGGGGGGGGGGGAEVITGTEEIVVGLCDNAIGGGGGGGVGGTGDGAGVGRGVIR